MSPVLLDPTGRSNEALAPMTERTVNGLDGKTVGLLHSTKFNSDRVLDAVAGLLEQRWALKKVVRARKPTFARSLPTELAASLASECDVVITGVGD
jgi:hypothetical protein